MSLELTQNQSLPALRGRHVDFFFVGWNIRLSIFVSFLLFFSDQSCFIVYLYAIESWVFGFFFFFGGGCTKSQNETCNYGTTVPICKCGNFNISFKCLVLSFIHVLCSSICFDYWDSFVTYFITGCTEIVCENIWWSSRFGNPTTWKIHFPHIQLGPKKIM